ncbi:Lebercilin [Geranomyces variabilis]|uniref:Lebercilin n=1 Tax=Geranomyces variabilis TaxID=109894 RepID=A0AAD5XLQ1_9FUNG|nr:Lebercilin [Geranomyces variabilis]
MAAVTTMQGAAPAEMDAPATIAPAVTVKAEDAGHFLPRMPKASSRTPSVTAADSRHEGHYNPPQSAKHQRAPPHEAHQYRHGGGRNMHIPGNIEILQAMMHERDVELLRLRHENSLLKQIERRQQKDIEQLEWNSDERVIHALREEVTGLKQKLKLYFTQLSANTRELRHVSDDRHRLKEQNARLEKLATDRHLAERDQLNGELERSIGRIAALERTAADAVKRAELTEKNMTVDNLHLRARIHTLENEVTKARAKAQKLDEHIRDREKEICSLEIYRYNAIHRKNEAVCKNCLNRDVDFSERKRKNEILAKLPGLSAPQIGAVTASTLEIMYQQPHNSISSGDRAVEYSSLSLLYSTDPTMKTGVERKELPIADARPEEKTAGGAKADQKARKKAGAGAAGKEGGLTVTLEQLQSGTEYHMQLVSGHLGVEGLPTMTVKVKTADAEPTTAHSAPADETSNATVPPQQPKLSVERLAESTVRVFAAIAMGEPRIQSYRVATIASPTTTESADPSVTEIEIPCANDSDDDEFSHVFEDLEVGRSFTFTFQAANKNGWSKPSEKSEPIILSPVVPHQRDPDDQKPVIVEPDPDFIRAAGIALPPSPLPPVEEPEQPVRIPTPAAAPSQDVEAAPPESPPNPDSAPEPGKLVKANSKTGSNLTLDQRVENMHHGLPAHFEPPPPVAVKAEG